MSTIIHQEEEEEEKVKWRNLIEPVKFKIISFDFLVMMRIVSQRKERLYIRYYTENIR
jgi:hypothetical protein